MWQEQFVSYTAMERRKLHDFGTTTKITGIFWEEGLRLPLALDVKFVY